MEYSWADQILHEMRFMKILSLD